MRKEEYTVPVDRTDLPQLTRSRHHNGNTHRHQRLRTHGTARFPRRLREIEFVHLNEVGGDGTTSAHLLYFDSVHGRWNREVRGEADKVIVEGKSVSHTSHKD